MEIIKDLLDFYTHFSDRDLSFLEVKRVMDAQPPARDKISTSLRLAVLRRDGLLCLRCGTTDNLTMDHIVPLSKGGETVEENLQTLCRSCNSIKRTNVIDFRVMQEDCAVSN